MRITLVTIAAACHAINKALCEANGDTSQPVWDLAPEWQRHSAINGVALHVTDPNMSAAASHESWMAQKAREGWAYGETKDPEKKLHPCFVPYDELPPAQKAKDYLFKATVAQFRPFLPGSELASAALIAQEFLKEHVMAPPPAVEHDSERLEAENRRLTAMEDEEERAKDEDDAGRPVSWPEEIAAAGSPQHAAATRMTNAERKAARKAEREAAKLAADTKDSAKTDPDAPEVEKATASA